MEFISSDESFKDFSKVLFIIKFGQKSKLLLGRGSNWDIIFNHNAISKFQAYFTLKKEKDNSNSLWIEDTCSKYGSLVLNTSPMEISSTSDHIWLSIGRALLKLRVKNLNHNWLCIFSNPFKIKQGVDVDCLKKYLSDEILDLISLKTDPAKAHVMATKADTKAQLKDIIDNLYLSSKAKSNPLVEDTKRRMIVVDGKLVSKFSNPFYGNHSN